MQIIGIDHVQFAVRNLAASERFFISHGYDLKFREPHFNSERRSFYRGVDHSLAYLARDGSRVELISGSAGQKGSRYTPLFDVCYRRTQSSAVLPERFRTFWEEELSTTCGSITNAPAVVDGLIVSTDDLDGSLMFWTSLGFELIGRFDRYYAHAFPRNSLSMPLIILLTPGLREACDEPKADDLGCSLIAFITRDLRADRIALKQDRHPVSEPARFCINRRTLSVCFAYGPGGELIELVEFGTA
jgi:hypothetical protein